MENLGLNRAFWHGRRVLLTGHTGFKGSWLLLLLESLGAEVTGVSLEASVGGLFSQLEGTKRCVHNIADIRDFSRIEAIVSEARPEIIFHLAAQALVRQSYVDPLETISTNILGTANLLQAARRADNLLALICVTTDKCYANDGRTTGYLEDDRLGGHDPYSNSKACAELVTQSFRDSFFEERSIGIATARAGNVIGGGDYAADRLIPDIIRALSQGSAPELRNPSAVRPWQHVLEPLNGYCILAEMLTSDPKRFAKGWNFGPASEHVANVGVVVSKLARFFGLSGDFAIQHGDHPHEAQVLTLNSAMAMRELGWAPRLSLETALAWTAQWYRARSAGEHAAALCLAQIDDYLARASIPAAA